MKQLLGSRYTVLAVELGEGVYDAEQPFDKRKSGTGELSWSLQLGPRKFGAGLALVHDCSDPAT
jgi:hypothetical protein